MKTAAIVSTTVLVPDRSVGDDALVNLQLKGYVRVG